MKTKALHYVLVFLILIGSISKPVSAIYEPVIESSKIVRSENHAYTLDFTVASTYRWHFDNDASLWFAHDTVTIEYRSNEPNNSYATITVELWHDHDKDGVYEPYSTTGSHTFTLRQGSTAVVQLPYGSELVSYMLKITNKTASVNNATIHVKTS